MPEKSKPCPQCGGTMSLRLGAYECAECGHLGDVQSPQPPEDLGGIRRPGFRREKWRPSSPPRAASPSPEARHELAFDADEQPAKDRLSTLDVEKRIYFGITVALAVIGVLADIARAVTGHGGLSWLLNGIFWDAVNVFLMAFVLFSREDWAKGCCAILVILELISMVGATFVVLPMLGGMIGASWLLPTFLTLPFWVAFAIHAGWYGWLLWILWRDYTSAERL